jgi:hypothetical protein
LNTTASEVGLGEFAIDVLAAPATGTAAATAVGRTVGLSHLPVRPFIAYSSPNDIVLFIVLPDCVQ